MSLIELGEILDRAEREYLLEDKVDFSYPLRRRQAVDEFYQKLDHELQINREIKVTAFRVVREGYAKVSRPASVGLSLETLLVHRPHLRLMRKEIQRWKEQIKFIDIHSFLSSHYTAALENPRLTAACFEIFAYLIEDPERVSGLMPRQIPHGQSTKLIGREPLLLIIFSFWRKTASSWRDFYAFFRLLDRPAEYRFYAPYCRLQNQRVERLHGVIAHDWKHHFDFSDLYGTLILENFQSFHLAAARAKSSLIVWGAGWRAALLRNLIASFPRPIFYWGDIDKEGYEIYGHLKVCCPEIEPLFMDKTIVEKYKHLQQKKPIYPGPYRQVPGQQAAYEHVCQAGIQIEQEQMTEPWPYHPKLI